MNVSNGILYTIAGVAGGGGLGYAYWKFVGCRSGMCPLTSTRLGSIIYGAVIGLMIASSAGCSSGTTTGNGNTPQQTSPAAEVHNISTAEFSEKMGGENVVVLDVRTPGEYNGGHLPKAVNVDYNNGFEAGMQNMDKSKTYLVYCQAGGRSAKATQWMVSNGFTNVYNMNGGFSAWNGEVE